LLTKTKKGHDVSSVEDKVKEMAAQMGVSVNDLLLYREMMLDRYAARYQNTLPTQSTDES
jgi:hypothetical protein